MPTKSTFESPFYALIGAADAAVENVRNGVDTAAESALSLRDELSPESVQERILRTVSEIRDQILAIPSLATERYELVAGSVERAYDDFAKSYLDYADRGVQVTREATEQGRSVVSVARANASETGDSTLATVFGVRKEAAKGVERLAGLVSRNADTIESDAETAVRSNAAKQGAANRPSRSSIARKTSTSKTAAKKTVAKKAPVKTTAAKKTTAKKTATKAAAKKAPAKKTSAVKAAPANTTAPAKTPASAKTTAPANTTTPAKTAAPANTTTPANTAADARTTPVETKAAQHNA